MTRVRQLVGPLSGEMSKGSRGEFYVVYHVPKFSDVYVLGCLPVALSPLMGS